LGREQKFEEAYAHFDAAYRLFDLNGNLDGLAEVALQRAVLLAQQRDTVRARDELTRALDKSTALENVDKRIRILLNLSNSWILAGDPAKAESFSTAALSLAQENKLQNLAIRGIIDIGNSHVVKGDYAEAEKHSRKL